MSLSREVGLSPGDIVLEWDPALPPPKAQFLAHVYCGQMAVWIKMALDIEVGVSPGDIVLDLHPAPPQKRTQPPNFWPVSIVAKRLYVSGYNLVRR